MKSRLTPEDRARLAASIAAYRVVLMRLTERFFDDLQQALLRPLADDFDHDDDDLDYFDDDFFNPPGILPRNPTPWWP